MEWGWFSYNIFCNQNTSKDERVKASKDDQRKFIYLTTQYNSTASWHVIRHRSYYNTRGTLCRLFGWKFDKNNLFNKIKHLHVKFNIKFTFTCNISIHTESWTLHHLKLTFFTCHIFQDSIDNFQISTLRVRLSGAALVREQSLYQYMVIPLALLQLPSSYTFFCIKELSYASRILCNFTVIQVSVNV